MESRCVGILKLVSSSVIFIIVRDANLPLHRNVLSRNLPSTSRTNIKSHILRRVYNIRDPSHIQLKARYTQPSTPASLKNVMHNSSVTWRGHIEACTWHGPCMRQAHSTSSGSELNSFPWSAKLSALHLLTCLFSIRWSPSHWIPAGLCKPYAKKLRPPSHRRYTRGGTPCN